ncbi:MAG: hypothetical protein ACR2PZ_15800 [Pseudomonadales bacterium]
MDWQIMVIGQLSLLLLGTAGACFWHIRKLRATNRSLFEALESKQDSPVSEDSPAESPADETAAATSDAEGSAVEEAPVAHTEAKAVPDGSAETEGPTSEVTEATQTPSTASAQSDADSQDGAVDMPNPGGDGLKKLLQQFTQDSRDMVTRIEQLERQTQVLIDQAKDEAAAASIEETTAAANEEPSEPANEEVPEASNAEAAG